MAGIDRLKELRGDTREEDEDDDVQPGGGGAEIAAHMQRYEPIKRALTTIEENVTSVNALKAKNKTTATEKQRKEVMSQLEKIMDSTSRNGTLIKKTLDEIKKENAEFVGKDKSNGESAKAQMRSNLYQTHIRKFHSVMNEYNTAAHSFKQDLQARTRREIKIVDANLSDQQVDQIIESGKAQDVIKEALISDNLKNVVHDIEERHLAILKLEHQVLEIYELFKDLATLVDLQQESLDVIENRILKAKNYTEKAEVELQEAEEYQKKARARRCCLLFIVLAVLVAVLLPSINSAIKFI